MLERHLNGVLTEPKRMDSGWVQGILYLGLLRGTIASDLEG